MFTQKRYFFLRMLEFNSVGKCCGLIVYGLEYQKICPVLINRLYI